MVTLRACRMPNATAAVVIEDPIGLGPSCNLISALSLMAGRLKRIGSGGGVTLATSNK